MNVSVLGCGRWACFIAWYLQKKKMNVTVWGREGSKRLSDLMKTHSNEYLSLEDTVHFTVSLKQAVSDADLIVISVASQACRDLVDDISKLNISPKPIVLCMKGLENSTGKRLSEIVREYLDFPVAIWVGPGHVQDFMNNIPNCMIIDSDDINLKTMLVSILNSSLIRFYIGSDLLGNEIGAATKNVMGIAAGMLDGLGYTSLKGALMARGTREVSRLIKNLGGNPRSAYGLAHLGDYQATLFSKYSNNRAYGECFVTGTRCNKLAEGYHTVQAISHIVAEMPVDLPICVAVNDILNNSCDAKQTLSNLFMRKIKQEFCDI